jgi:hypothetical protein
LGFKSLNNLLGQCITIIGSDLDEQDPGKRFELIGERGAALNNGSQHKSALDSLITLNFQTFKKAQFVPV